MVTVVLPGLAVILFPRLVWSLPWPFVGGLRMLGLTLFALGLMLLVETGALLTEVGEGTLAPWDPTRRLVVEGIYRHVRNPMISGVLAMLLGEALLTRSWLVLAWAALFTVVNLVYTPRVEEPRLVRRFGAPYEHYRQHVPRWLPRRTPWGDADETSP